jgi:hypothetical protein
MDNQDIRAYHQALDLQPLLLHHQQKHRQLRLHLLLAVGCWGHFLQCHQGRREALADLANHMLAAASPGDNQAVARIGDEQDRAYLGMGMDKHLLHQAGPSVQVQAGRQLQQQHHYHQMELLTVREVSDILRKKLEF